MKDQVIVLKPDDESDREKMFLLSKACETNSILSKEILKLEDFMNNLNSLLCNMINIQTEKVELYTDYEEFQKMFIKEKELLIEFSKILDLSIYIFDSISSEFNEKD